MEYIMERIANNKVTLNIKSNSYEESAIFHECSDQSIFDSLDDIVQMYKSSRLQPPLIKSKIVIQDNKINPLKDFDLFLLSIMSIIDSSVVILPIPSQIEKINTFKRQLFSAISMVGDQCTQHVLSTETFFNKDFLSFIANSIHHNIFVWNDKDKQWFVGLDESSCACLVYKDIPSWDKPKILKDGLQEMLKEVVQFRAKQYISNGVMQKLNQYLVPELKDIAHHLYIPTTTTSPTSGKPKNLLKSELKELVKNKLLEYKQ